MWTGGQEPVCLHGSDLSMGTALLTEASGPSFPRGVQYEPWGVWEDNGG